MANELGRRYVCDECGTEVLCSKKGEGSVSCCNKELQLQRPKPLPSAD